MSTTLNQLPIDNSEPLIAFNSEPISLNSSGVIEKKIKGVKDSGVLHFDNEQFLNLAPKNKESNSAEIDFSSLAEVAGRFSNQIVHGKYSSAFSQVLSHLNTLNPEVLKSHEIEVWTTELLTQLLEETQGFQKIVREDKFSSFIYYLNMLLAKIEKDYAWLKNCLPLNTIDYIFSNLIQHNELSMARSFLPIITDRNFENYNQTLQYCFINKNKDAFDFLTENLNGIGALSVDLLLDVYENFGSKVALDFQQQYKIDVCDFGLKNPNSSLLTKIFEKQDKEMLSVLLQRDPELFERALSHHALSGENSFSHLNAKNILVFKDMLFSQELSSKALLHLYNISFDINFISQASGTDYYKKLFSQNLFDSKDASRGRLEIYYDLCDLSYQELSKTKENHSPTQIQNILNNLNQTIAVIEDFLTHYKKPITPIQNLNELTYILELQKKIPYIVNSSLIDKVMRLRPDLVESGQAFVATNYQQKNPLIKNTGFFNQDTEGKDKTNANNAKSTPDTLSSEMVEVWLREIKDFAITFFLSPKTIFKYYREIKKEKKEKISAQQNQRVEALQSGMIISPAQFKLEVDKSLSQLKQSYEQLNISDLNKAKCAHLLNSFEEINALVMISKHSLTPEESHMLRHHIPSHIKSVMGLYERLQSFDNSAILEKLELQYDLLKTQLELFKKTLSEDISQKIEKEISAQNILLSNKNVKYQSLSASK